MASRLELRRLRDVPSFLAAALRIRRQMLASPGVLGLSLIARPLHRTARRYWWAKWRLTPYRFGDPARSARCQHRAEVHPAWQPSCGL